MKLATLILTAAPLAVVFGGDMIPTADGTSWRYDMTEEIGKGLDLRNAKTDADGKIRLQVLYRIDGTEMYFPPESSSPFFTTAEISTSTAC